MLNELRLLVKRMPNAKGLSKYDGDTCNATILKSCDICEHFHLGYCECNTDEHYVADIDTDNCPYFCIEDLNERSI